MTEKKEYIENMKDIEYLKTINKQLTKFHNLPIGENLEDVMIEINTNELLLASNTTVIPRYVKKIYRDKRIL